MGLDININIVDIDNSPEAIPTKTPFIDTKNGRISGYIDGLDAMKQFIDKTLSTARFVYAIYDTSYATDQSALLGNNEDMQYIMSEGKRIVKDALLADNRITNVRDFTIGRENDEIKIVFSADTIFGPLDGLEVRLNV